MGADHIARSESLYFVFAIEVDGPAWNLIRTAGQGK